jgi:hypothetical protein
MEKDNTKNEVLSNLPSSNCENSFEGKKYELIDYKLEKDVFECSLPEGEDLPQFSFYDTKLLYRYNELTFNEDTCEVIRKEMNGAIPKRLRCANNGRDNVGGISTKIVLPDGTEQQVSLTYTYIACKNKCYKTTTIIVGNISYDIISYDKVGDKKENVTHSDYVTCCGCTSTIIDGKERVINEVDYTVEYTKVIINDECKEERNVYTYEGIWRPEACNGDNCCSSHYITTSITETIEGIDVNLNLSVLMKGDSEKQCNPDCDCEPTSLGKTYCIDADSVVVKYAVISESGDEEWVENGKVSKNGGKVKVIFNYTEYDTQIDCDGKTVVHESEGTHEEIIDIPACLCPNDPNCIGELNGEIVFKEQHEQGCNIITYHVEQEMCKDYL